MPQLHETILGRRVFEHDLPSIAKNLDTISKNLNVIANALQEQNEIAVRTNAIMIEANELKKRELDFLETSEPVENEIPFINLKNELNI